MSDSSRPAPVALALAFLGPDFTLFFIFLRIYITLGIVYGARIHVLGESSIVLTWGIACSKAVGRERVYRRSLIGQRSSLTISV